MALNPSGVLLTLVHARGPTVKSSVLNERLDEVFPSPSLRPADALIRADMRVWVKFEDDVLLPAVRRGTFSLMIKSVVRGVSGQALVDMIAAYPKPAVVQDWMRIAEGPVDEVAMAAAGAKLHCALARMEQRLEGHAWLAGDAYSLEDIAVAPMLDRMVFLSLAGAWHDTPGVSDRFERVRVRPAFLQAAPAPGYRMAAGAASCTA